MEITITPKNETSKGAYCLFVKLDDMHGVKFYNKPKYRDQAKQLQDQAHSVACGPAVYGDVEMEWLEAWTLPNTWTHTPKRVYGYVTDLVTPCTLSEDEYAMLRARLKYHGIESPDVSFDHNVGKNFSGIPVKYDFDPATNW